LLLIALVVAGSVTTCRASCASNIPVPARESKAQQLEAVEGQVGRHHFREFRLETAQAKAERTITEELGRLGWQQPELALRGKHLANLRGSS